LVEAVQELVSRLRTANIELGMCFKKEDASEAPPLFEVRSSKLEVDLGT
jgi:hypothetical protein